MDDNSLESSPTMKCVERGSAIKAMAVEHREELS